MSNMDGGAPGSFTTEQFGAGRTVAVVDDDSITLEAIQAILEYDGYEVAAFTDALAAQQSLALSQPNLVILDMMLRGQNGSAVLDDLKADPVTAGIPVLICTAAALTPAEVERLERLSCVLLSKPFELDELLQVARQLTCGTAE
jgi:CheY-like chemotaxis protein